MSDLRIFSYLPNPRIWKATIAARLCGVKVEVRGAPAGELADWLWDFDAHPMTEEDRKAAADLAQGAKTGFTTRLYKTEAFLEAQPFGTVPAAFSPDGRVGIYESNSIMRTVARLGADHAPLYGEDAYTASRIDSYLDASLVFARDAQLYILALRAGSLPRDVHIRARQAFESWMTGTERALMHTGDYIVDDGLTIADICFVAEYALFQNERLHAELLLAHEFEPIFNDRVAENWPRAVDHFDRLSRHRAFAPDVEPFLLALGKP